MKHVLVAIAGGLTGALVFLLFIGAALAEYTCNCGPNSSVFSPPPQNPQTQSIHPSK